MNIKDYLKEHTLEFKRWLIDNEQGRIDIKILPYLQDIDKGLFVEAGALDGLFMSNTKLLEDLGWNGLLVEPSHKAVLRCKQNRKVPIEECALVSKDFKENVVYGDFVLDGEFGMGAWSSINRRSYGVLSEEKTFNSFVTQVPARTFESIFDEHKITKVDLLSLDVEGYELEALKGIDFTKVDIRYLLIEINSREYHLEDMDTFLQDKGYKRIACLSNFSSETNEGWDGSHQDYLYGRP